MRIHLRTREMVAFLSHPSYGGVRCRIPSPTMTTEVGQRWPVPIVTVPRDPCTALTRPHHPPQVRTAAGLAPTLAV